jgi:hypothetical protein
VHPSQHIIIRPHPQPYSLCHACQAVRTIPVNCHASALRPEVCFDTIGMQELCQMKLPTTHLSQPWGSVRQQHCCVVCPSPGPYPGPYPYPCGCFSACAHQSGCAPCSGCDSCCRCLCAVCPCSCFCSCCCGGGRCCAAPCDSCCGCGCLSSYHVAWGYGCGWTCASCGIMQTTQVGVLGKYGVDTCSGGREQACTTTAQGQTTDAQSDLRTVRMV